MNEQSNLSRRRFLLASPAALAVLPQAGMSGGLSLNAEAALGADQKPMIFDPLLDPACRLLPSPAAAPWQACWIWFPGQLAAFLHQRRVHACVLRCTSVGYPSSFRQGVPYAYFRKRAELAGKTAIRWKGPLSRIRVLLNGVEGDITNRTLDLPPGKIELVVRIDFVSGLPCLLLDGAPFSTDESWEASLDFRTWVPAECEPRIHDSLIFPDTEREVLVEIPPSATADVRKAALRGGAYELQAGGGLTLDFRHDELGHLAFDIEGSGELSVVVGESLLEASDPDPKHFEQYPLEPVALTAGRRRSVVLPERCVRFARFQSSGNCLITNLRFQAKVTPVEYRGHFESSDPELNAIWATGAATIHSCMHDFYLDGIRRDALPWDDGTINIEAADLLFFDATTTRQSLLTQTLPSQPTRADLGILDAPLYALLGFENDLIARGDLSFSKRYRDRLTEILEFFIGLQDERGFVNAHQVQPYGFFPDWSATRKTGPDAHGTPAYAQMLQMRAFEIGAAFCRRWADEAGARRYASIADGLRKKIRECFWDTREKAFINGYNTDGSTDKRLSSFAQVFAILFDLAAPDEWPALFERVLENPACRAPNISILYFYEMVAYAKAGRTEAALRLLKKVWGQMLKDGYTRFAEDIRPRDSLRDKLRMYRHPFGNSLCHDWAGATPVILLARGVLGLWPKSPGYSECEIRPQLAGLEWAGGRFPTPSGPISIRIQRDKPGTLTLPPQVTAHLTRFVDARGSSTLKGPGTFTLVARQ